MTVAESKAPGVLTVPAELMAPVEWRVPVESPVPMVSTAREAVSPPLAAGGSGL